MWSDHPGQQVSNQNYVFEHVVTYSGLEVGTTYTSPVTVRAGWGNNCQDQASGAGVTVETSPSGTGDWTGLGSWRTRSNVQLPASFTPALLEPPTTGGCGSQGRRDATATLTFTAAATTLVFRVRYYVAPRPSGRAASDDMGVIDPVLRCPSA